MSASVKDSEPVNVLLVDDHEEGLLALEAVLSRPEYRLIRATSGSEAMKRLLDHEVAVILMDVQMPEMDGFETAAFIKQRARSRDIPIIFLTALNKEEEHVYRGYEVGAVDYLFKPLEPQILTSKVAVFVDLFKKTRELKQHAERIQEIERREREAQLTAVELSNLRRYRNLADAIPNIVWRAKACGEKEYFSKVWVDYTGMSLERSLNRGWRDAIHLDDRREYLCAWKAALQEEGGLEVECRIRRALDGEYRWHLCQAVPERAEDGRIIAWLGTFTEIHDRKNNERERLRLLARAEESATRFSQLASMLPQFVWESGESGVTWSNQRWAEYTGLPLEKSLGSRWLDVVHPEDRPGVEAKWRELIQGGVSEFLAKYRLLGKDGKHRWFLGQGVPLPHTQGEGRRWVGITTDIQAFYDLDEQRANFLSLASHELKTPLTAIKASLQLQELVVNGVRDVPRERLAPIVRTGARAAARLNDLLDDLLDYSRVESGRLAIAPERSDLVESVREAIAGQTLQPEDRARIRVDLPERLEGWWDIQRLRQVADNLLSNALKYTPKSGKIEISLKQEGKEAVLRIQDEGIGIDASDQKRIFKPFERAVEPKNYGGIGVGLYVSSRIVEQHRGRIEVESVKGKGSTFIVRLPVEIEMQAEV